MNHTGTVLLDTARLSLRPFILEDAPNMYKNWASDPRVTRYLTWTPHASVEETKQIVGFWVEQYGGDLFYQWVIVLKEINEVIGNISVVQQDEDLETAVIGYCMGQKWWGQGIMTEAYTAVLAHLFRQVGFNRVAATHHVANPASGRVMVKCGMTYEGLRRDGAKDNQGKFCDVECYAILKKDWMQYKSSLS